MAVSMSFNDKIQFPSLDAISPSGKSSYRRAAPQQQPREESSGSGDDSSVGFREQITPFKVPQKPQAWKQHQPYVGIRPTVAKPKVVPPRPQMTLVDVLTQAMTFLPLDDIEIARQASPQFAEAASRVAPKPLPCDDMVFVRWEPQELHTAVAQVLKVPTRRSSAAPTTVPTVFNWRCLSCGNISQGPRQCVSCQAPLSSAACRVFIGQIRKDLSAEFTTAMVRSLLPDVTILHMESHTNGADGRGKGCAWAYVNSVEDALRVTSLHKRVFADIDAENAEGFWFAKDPQLVGHLSVMAETIGQNRQRPVWLPRQALVAELPANSMLAQYVASLSVSGSQP
jgi:hypothetical protein